jgi:four helix bundle protein
VPSAKVRDYRDLFAWQQAMELALEVESICDRLPRSQWQLVSQMRRAANSIHSNIAEGNGRFSLPDYLRHLSIANASLRELQSDLHFLIRRNEGNAKARQALNRSVTVGKLLMRLVSALRQKQEG